MDKLQQRLSDVSIQGVLICDRDPSLRIQGNRSGDGLEVAQRAIAKHHAICCEQTALEDLRNALDKSRSWVTNSMILYELLYYERCSTGVSDEASKKGIDFVLPIKL